MTRKLAPVLTAAYLILCVLLGGSAQGIWGNLALQLLGIALITFAAIAPDRSEPGSWARILAALFLLGVLAVLLQLVPIPPDEWAKLPGRSQVVASSVLAYPIRFAPVSLTPYASVASLFATIPAASIFLFIAVLRPAPRSIAIGIVTATLLSIVFGAIQVAGGSRSWAYLYKVTNGGAVGFFANRNHMGTLLLVAIPMAAALLCSVRADNGFARGRYGVGAVLIFLLVIGVALNQSLAVFALVIPVFVASATLFPVAVTWRRFVLPTFIVALMGGIVLLAPSGIGETRDLGASTSVSSRLEIWKTATMEIADSFPLGMGLGSFEQVNHLYEDPTEAKRTYVNHVHNDYLELVLELGVAGVFLILLFLVWWTVSAIRIWRSRLSTPMSRAATIATAAILAHSIVDFPLRTEAVSAIFGACLGLMAEHFQSQQSTGKKGEARPARHVNLG